ncbi:MAG TPA: glycosyltransferase family 2 protein [Pyrinomonadaceae bacterium]|jgi:glycosyltransferase involved in cell wall biosynthesis
MSFHLSVTKERRQVADGDASASLVSPEISVVVPVYRNADTLRELHRRLRRTMTERQLSYEIIFVEDCCPAGSLEVLKELAQRDARAAVLSLAANVGQHSAVLVGLRYSRGRWTIVMDADLQDPPEAVPLLLDAADESVGAVFAGRRGRYESFSRLLTSRLFKGLLHLLCGVPRDAGIFVALSRPLVERLLKMRAGRPFVVSMIGCAGLPMLSLPVERSRRATGESAYNFRGRLRSASRAIVWVLRWKLQRIWPSRLASSASGDESQVASFFGRRFDEPESELADRRVRASSAAKKIQR